MKLLKIKKIKKQTSHDLNIEDTNTFFANGVLVHNSNAGVSINKNGDIWGQSRKGIVTIKQDNMGFAFFVEKNKETFVDLFNTINFVDADFITIFGEWCGKGIQKGMGINHLEKMFVIFAVKLSYNDEEKTNRYLKPENFDYLKSEENRIYNIQNFQTKKYNIDFNKPAEIQNELIDDMLEVEKECPVAKALGVIGIGEGIVLKHYSDDGSVLQFKVKGDLHQSSGNKGKGDKKKQIISPEKLNSINEFVEYAVTEGRLNQAIEQVFTINGEDIDIKKLGHFLKWMMSDIVSEEIDTMKSNGLEPKDVGKAVSLESKKWFLEKWNKV